MTAKAGTSVAELGMVASDEQGILRNRALSRLALWKEKHMRLIKPIPLHSRWQVDT